MPSKCFWPCFRAIMRTLFYQLFILFCISCIVVVSMPQSVGFRSMTIYMSYLNHFHPINFEQALPTLLGVGQFRIWALQGYPDNFKVLEEAMAAEEWYWCKFEYTDKNKRPVIDIDSTRIRWKPWEYYYKLEKTWEDAEMQDYLENGTLNSKQTDKANRLRREYLELQRNRRRV